MPPVAKTSALLSEPRNLLMIIVSTIKIIINMTTLFNEINRSPSNTKSLSRNGTALYIKTDG